MLRVGEDMTSNEAAAFELKTFSHYNRNYPYGREGYYAFREKRVPAWKVVQ
jgi:hypothetical protein